MLAAWHSNFIHFGLHCEYLVPLTFSLLSSGLVLIFFELICVSDPRISVVLSLLHCEVKLVLRATNSSKRKKKIRSDISFGDYLFSPLGWLNEPIYKSNSNTCPWLRMVIEVSGTFLALDVVGYQFNLASFISRLIYIYWLD